MTRASQVRGSIPARGLYPISSPSCIRYSTGAWLHSLGSVGDDYRKVKELLMLDDSSSKGTISARFGFR